jgi:Zn-dependent peptidase ImmA (M78 family)
MKDDKISHLLQILVEESPVPVNFGPCSQTNMVGEYKHKKSFTDAKIIISDRPKIEQLGTLAHELGHALCVEKGCVCMDQKLIDSRDRELAEYHAQKFALEWLLKHQCKEAIILEMYWNWQQSQYENKHKIPCMRLMKSEVWTRCKIFVNWELV